MKLVIENQLATVYYDQDTQILYSYYSGTPFHSAAMEILDTVFDFVRENTAVATFTDMSEVKGTFTHVNSYVSEKIMPECVKRGLKVNVSVLPKDVFGQFALNDLIKQLDNSVIIRTFDDVEEAKAWLYSTLEIANKATNEV